MDDQGYRKVTRERFSSMKKSFDKATTEGKCQRCGSDTRKIEKRNIGLNCCYAEAKIIDDGQEINEDDEYFICKTPYMVHLCLSCYLEMIRWLEIPEYDTEAIPFDLDIA